MVMSKPLLRVPLPPHFLTTLGYERAVAGSVQLARRFSQATGSPMPSFEPRRFVGLYWESGGDELGWSDGCSSGAGQLNHWPFLDWRHKTLSFLEMDQGWSLGSTDGPEDHWMVCDRESNRDYVYPVAV